MSKTFLEAEAASLKYKQAKEGNISSRADKQAEARRKLVIEGVKIDPSPYEEEWEKSTAGQKIPKPGRGKYDREHLLGKIKQQHKKGLKLRHLKDVGLRANHT